MALSHIIDAFIFSELTPASVLSNACNAIPYFTSGPTKLGLSVNPKIQEFLCPPFTTHRLFIKIPVFVAIFGDIVSLE